VQATSAPPDQDPDKTGGSEKKGWSENLKTVAGLTAVVVGTIVVGIIAAAAISKGTDTAGQIASSAGGVIATIVGAYFGVKVGSDQVKEAIDGQKAESAKAQAFAAHIPSEKAEAALDRAEQAAKRAAPR
jgi:hypothetical protein